MIFGKWIGLTKRLPSRQQLRILVIDDFVPDPIIGAGSPRALQFLRALKNTGAAVTFFPTLPRPDGLRTKRFPIPDIAWIKRGSGRITALAPFLKRHHQRFDAIIVSRRHNLLAFNEAISVNRQIQSSKTIIFDSEAVFAAREALQRQILNRPSGANEMSLHQEIELSRSARTIIAVNKIDAAAFENAGHRDVLVLGHAVTPAFSARPHAERSRFLFVGPTYGDDTPNSDSVVWFVDRVLPLLRARLGFKVVLSHVGRSAAPALRARSDRIEAIGQVNDLTDAFGSARVFVAPTRFASGIPLKVCEAAAHGVPCVLTPLLAGQLDWQHEREALVAESPEDFARQCVRLFNDADLWERIRTTAFRRIAQDCDQGRFDQIVSDLCATIKHRAELVPATGS